jgi:hypothetical protein
MWTFGNTTTSRVPAHTVEAVNRRIANQAERRIDACRQHPEEIERRLRALDREWDIERSLEANAATICIAAVLLASSSTANGCCCLGSSAPSCCSTRLKGGVRRCPSFAASAFAHKPRSSASATR